MRAARLRRSSDIALLRAEGRSLRRSSFNARVRRTSASAPRLAVTAPRSIGGSVTRNRARRRIREAFRIAFAELAAFPPIDLHVTARREAGTVEFGSLRAEAASLLREAMG